MRSLNGILMRYNVLKTSFILHRRLETLFFHLVAYISQVSISMEEPLFEQLGYLCVTILNKSIQYYQLMIRP